ncbi:MAG: CAP domain-containing protein [Polyangia bacterium]|nr:CAP domain-containing protein [Polyangia bacterium]
MLTVLEISGPGSGPGARCLGSGLIGRALAFMALFGAGLGVSCDDGNDGSQVPDIPYCDPVANWGSEWLAWEARMVDLMNEARAQGATCGSTPFASTGPLEPDPRLRCAARVHSRDMYVREFFDHTNPDGEGPTERFHKAGWSGSTWGENIVGGYGSVEAQFAGWMGSEGHCRNIMSSSFTQVGIGYFHGEGGYGDYTTAGFGRP